MRHILLVVALFALLCASAASAAPTQTPSVLGVTAEIVFDPPIGEELKYRSENMDSRDGASRFQWSVDSYRFDVADKGYRLTVRSLSFGSNEIDPVRLKLEKRLAELTNRPFVLRLSEDAEILQLEDEASYWSAIQQALRDALTKHVNKPTEMETKAIGLVMSMFEGMSAEARLAKLTEPVQPLVEFAFTELTQGEPIVTTAEVQGPFGATMKQNIAISLTDVRDGFAFVTIRASIPSAELQKLMKGMSERLSGVLNEDERANMTRQLAALKDFNSETVGEYQISLEDGLLESFDSTQQISVSDGSKREVRTKTRRLKRIH